MHILEQLLNYNILHIEITIDSIIFLQKFHKIKNMEISIKVEALNLMSMCQPSALEPPEEKRVWSTHCFSCLR
jgi:hypothetical protein